MLAVDDKIKSELEPIINFCCNLLVSGIVPTLHNLDFLYHVTGDTPLSLIYSYTQNLKNCLLLFMMLILNES